jgi:hypothetical protein
MSAISRVNYLVIVIGWKTGIKDDGWGGGKTNSIIDSIQNLFLK